MMADGVKLLKFHTYTFTTAQSTYNPKLNDPVTQTVRIAGMDGGFDVYRSGAAPVAVGDITLRFTLAQETQAGMTALRDAVDTMTSWGKRKLWMQPSSEASPKRWAWARVSSQGMSQKLDEHTDLLQPVDLHFQLAEPVWYAQPSGWYLDDGYLLDAGLTFGGPRASSSSISSGSTLSATNNGSTPVMAKLTFKAGAQTASQISAYVTNEYGNMACGFLWEGALAANENLVVNGFERSVLHDAVTGITSGYSSFTRLAGTGFIVLQPGANTITVTGTFSGNITLEVDYFDGYKS